MSQPRSDNLLQFVGRSNSVTTLSPLAVLDAEIKVTPARFGLTPQHVSVGDQNRNTFINVDGFKRPNRIVSPSDESCTTDSRTTEFDLILGLKEHSTKNDDLIFVLLGVRPILKAHDRLLTPLILKRLGHAQIRSNLEMPTNLGALSDCGIVVGMEDRH